MHIIFIVFAVCIAHLLAELCVSADALNLRKGPCTDQPIVVTLSQHTEFQKLDQQTTCGHTWFKINAQGKKIFCWTKFCHQIFLFRI